MEDASNMPTKFSLATPIGGSVLVAFVWWWLIVAPAAILSIWRNYLAANLHYFSITLLLRTLVAPWHRDTEDYGRGFDPLRYTEAAIVNTMSRIIGAIIRTVTILIGLVVELAILAVGPLVFITWYAAPFLFYLALTHTPTVHLSAPQLPTLPTIPHINFGPPTIHGVR